jgi:Mg2+ and Co2+ transporter CorA
MEIVLLVFGGLAFVVSFFLPGGAKGQIGEAGTITQNEIKDMVAKEIQQIKSQVDGAADEAVEYAMEKTERSLEKLSNEKIMAVSEYSDTVLREIDRNHKEVMFLYDLLNEKQKSIKVTVAELQKTTKEAEASAKEAGLSLSDTPVTALQHIPAYMPPSKPQSVTTPYSGDNKLTSSGMIGQNNQAGQIIQPVSSPTEQQSQESNRNDKVLELYQKGKKKVEIAKELGLGVGEVKLVLDLYGK